MKKILSLFGGMLFSLMLLGQTSTLTVVLKGTKNQQLLIDGKDYTPADIRTSNMVTVTIPDLSIGQHELEVIRNDGNSYNDEDDDVISTFTIRKNFDKRIVVTPSGSLQQSETKKTYGAGTKTPMSTTAFNSLLSSLQNERSYARRARLNETFANTNNFFTTSQISQLLQTIYSESHRLELAKASYKTVTDPWNFAQVNNLLYSQASKDELTAYVNSYNKNYTTTTNYRVAMTDASFNSVYQNVYNQNSQTSRMILVSNALNTTGNYFTTYQVRQLISLLNDERNRLDLAKLAYRTVVDIANFGSLYDLLSLSSSKTELSNYIRTVNSSATAMSVTNYNSLYQSISSQNSYSARLTALTNALNTVNNFYTADQVRRLLLLINSESDRLNLAKLSYRTIVDPVNFSQLYSVFSSTANRTALETWVNTYYYDGVSTTRSPMSESNFNSLYRSVQYRIGIGAKMSALTEIFANNSNYFTTDQAERLIRLVSSETNRLQLAKSAYSHVTDPANFPNLYDMFSTQSARYELENYVKNNSGTYGTVDNNNYYSTRVAMTDASFNTLYDDINSTYGWGAKMSAISDAFNVSTNYFTVAQTEKLIRLVSSEDNRLQLAKQAYTHLTDPQNISDLYDIFSSQSYIDELKSYIASH